ncbi:hypothetical protein MW887_009261 [Aspergillus wentii]|nr:hypothetical protein MW887_009261 [Aspergillus wentii]
MDSRRDPRVKKRSSNACHRCRRQKIKCSGSQPCDTCNKRKLTCTFDDRDQKILVTRGFIDDLQRKIALLERGDEEPFSPQSYEPDPRPEEAIASFPDEDHGESSYNSALTNPLSTGPSTFMTAGCGRTFYLGTSSNWSFARRVLSLTHEHIHHAPLPTGRLLFDGAAYDLGWDGSRTAVSPQLPMAPTLDFSIYLINAVKFHAGQLFHLFDEPSFMGNLYAFYEDPQQMTTSNLWYIHYLLILAFGKAFVVQKNQGRRPPGCEFFTKALQLLPDSTQLSREPVIACEILCCIALYLQSLDCRSTAHNFIGQAVRIALAQGMHTNMPVEPLGEALVQRCRKIWWTTYILDRQMTSLMGLPQSIHDDQLHYQLPLFTGSPQKVAALSMQIKLCQIIAEVNSTVYGPDGRLNRKFLLRTKAALSSTADLADELQNSFDLRLDESSISGVSRLSAHLHLLYHQCMVLATRPLLFCFLKIRFQSPADLESLHSSSNVRKLLQSTRTKSSSFLPFDLDSTFVSAVILLVAPVIDPNLLDDWTPWLYKTYMLLDEMISRGNLIAEFGRSELEQLNEMLIQLSPDLEKRAMALSMSTPICNSNTFAPEGLSTAEILAVAESIDTGDVDWIAHAITENSIW